MVRKPVKPFAQVVADAGRYPEDAFHFIREALNFAVEKIHGPSTPQQLALYELLDQKSIDLHELVEAYERGNLSPQFARAIGFAGVCPQTLGTARPHRAETLEHSRNARLRPDRVRHG